MDEALLSTPNSKRILEDPECTGIELKKRKIEFEEYQQEGTDTAMEVGTGQRQQGSSSVSPTKTAVVIAPAVQGKGLIEEEPEEKEKSNLLQSQGFPEDKALSKILLHMDVNDLKNCRLVSSRWKSVSTEIFVTRVVVRCTYKDATTGFFARIRHTDLFSITDESLTNLIDCIKLSDGFPCPSFDFSGGYLNDPQLQNFLALHGPGIKDLSLDVIATYADLSKLLVEQAPNVEKLDFGQLPGVFQLGARHKEPRSLFPENQVRLHNLKDLQFLCKAPIKIVTDLLLAAENLKSVLLTEMNRELLDFLQNSNKLHLMSYLNFEPTEDNMPTFERISNNVNDLKLKQFQMDLETVYDEPELWKEAAKQLSKILFNSAGTLEMITWQNLRFLNEIHVPKFPKVETIRFVLLGFDTEHEYKYFFPLGLSMSRAFPCLKKVLLGFHPYNGYNDVLECYFDSTAPVRTVKEFCLEDCNFCSEPSEWISKYSRMFPNVTIAAFKGIIDFCDIANEIWKFSKVEELVLHIEVSGGDKEFLSNDTAFTGFPEERVTALLKEKPKSVALAVLKKWRLKKSILDLKNLSKLRLTFYNDTDDDDPDGEEEPNEISSIITEVTGRFGFGMCPRLSVEVFTVANDLKYMRKMVEAVSDIRPYVDSGPW